jgi:hypothetical protein
MNNTLPEPMDAFVLGVSRPMDAAEERPWILTNGTDGDTSAIMRVRRSSFAVSCAAVSFRGLNRRGQPKTRSLASRGRRNSLIRRQPRLRRQTPVSRLDAPRSYRSVWPRRLNGSRLVGDPTSVEAKGHAHGKFNDR